MKSIPVYDNPLQDCDVLVTMPTKEEGHLAPLTRLAMEKFPGRVYAAASQGKLLSGIYEPGPVVGYLTEDGFTPIEEKDA